MRARASMLSKTYWLRVMINGGILSASTMSSSSLAVTLRAEYKPVSFPIDMYRFENKYLNCDRHSRSLRPLSQSSDMRSPPCVGCGLSRHALRFRIHCLSHASTTGANSALRLSGVEAKTGWFCMKGGWSLITGSRPKRILLKSTMPNRLSRV